MDTTVRILTRGTHPTPWLEVDYPGLRPPLALFADLEMIGWAPPAIQPPPAAAIDWSAPNPATGERFTIRDYPVTGAVVQPPTGSGRDGAWTGAEALAFTAVLRGVLERHGVSPEGGVEVATTAADAAPGARGLDEAPPARRRRFGRAAGRDTASGEPAAPTPIGPVLPLSRKGEIGTILEATAIPDRRADLEAAAAALGFPYEVRVVDARTVESYRASTYETVTPAVCVMVAVPPSEEARATAVLAEVGLIAPEMVVVPDTAPPAPEPALTPVAPIPTAVPQVDPELATIELSFDPDRRFAVDEAVAALGIVPVAERASTRTEVNSYRGTRYESVVPAVHMVFGVDPAAAPRVSTVLAAAARANPSDPEQLAVTLPPPPVEAAVTEEAPTGPRPLLVISAS